MSLVAIEPLHSGPLMPAIAIGFGPELPHPWDPPSIAELPPWLFLVEQQAGGMAMSYPDVLGVMLRLEANREFALRDPESILHGFHLMAEDPKLGVLQRDYPELRTFCDTWGERLDDHQIANFDRALSPYFRLPPAKGGLEACVELEQVDILSYFRGWRLVELDRSDSPQGLTEERVPWCDSRPLDEDIIDQLRAIGSQLTPNQPLSLFFLWENSD